MDKAGRVVLPKALREELNLLPGDSLQVTSDGFRFTAEPVQAESELIEKEGMLVFRSRGDRSITLEDTNRWMAEMREERERSHMGIEE